MCSNFGIFFFYVILKRKIIIILLLRIIYKDCLFVCGKVVVFRIVGFVLFIFLLNLDFFGKKSLFRFNKSYVI